MRRRAVVNGQETGPEQQPVGSAYFDAEGNRTENPAEAVRGELVEHDPRTGRATRTRFLFKEVEIKWLPVRESAFLLWVLLGLLLAWVLIGFAFGWI
jgi:hypothetical protein